MPVEDAWPWGPCYRRHWELVSEQHDLVWGLSLQVSEGHPASTSFKYTAIGIFSSVVSLKGKKKKKKSCDAPAPLKNPAATEKEVLPL